MTNVPYRDPKHSRAFIVKGQHASTLAVIQARSSLEAGLEALNIGKKITDIVDTAIKRM